MSPQKIAALRRQSEALLGGEEPRGSAQDLYGLMRDLSGFLEEATLEELAGAAFPEEAGAARLPGRRRQPAAMAPQAHPCRPVRPRRAGPVARGRPQAGGEHPAAAGTRGPPLTHPRRFVLWISTRPWPSQGGLFVTACRGNLSGGEDLHARYLLYLVKCHRQHFWLHGLHGRDIDDPSIQSPYPERTTRARLRELAQLARAARHIRRPYRALEALDERQ